MKSQTVGNPKAVAAGAVAGVPGDLRARIAEAMQQMSAGTGNPAKPRYLKRPGYSVAEGKRRARKARNRRR